MLFSFRHVHIDSNLNVPSLAGKKKKHTSSSSYPSFFPNRHKPTDFSGWCCDDFISAIFLDPPQSRWIPMLPRLLRHGLLRILRGGETTKLSETSGVPDLSIESSWLFNRDILKIYWFMRIPMYLGIIPKITLKYQKFFLTAQFDINKGYDTETHTRFGWFFWKKTKIKMFWRIFN